MKLAEINKKPFTYLLYEGKEAERDEDGHRTGDYIARYSEPVTIRGNISPATGFSEVEQFGSLQNYDKVIIIDNLNCPIDENSVLFVDKPVEYDEKGLPKHDYTVARVAKSLNYISYAITKVKVS